MNSTFFKIALVILAGTLFICACSNNGPGEEAKMAATPPSFVISISPIVKSPRGNFPYLQSFAWARKGNKIIMIGGRIEGFHGQIQMDTIFNARKANTSIWLVDLDDFSFSELPLNFKDSLSLQLASTNIQFCQSGDTLFLVGGFGLKKSTDIQSNFTFDRIISFSVSKLINQIQSKGDPSAAIIDVAKSPFLQVTGGELFFDKGWFYLMFGQNYKEAYNVGLTGEYTSAIRKFKLQNGQLTDTVSYQDNTLLHRRDLTVSTIIQKNGNFHAAFGGVFTKNNNGYLNPVYIDVNNNSVIIKQDTLSQKTNQYLCANASVYDAASNSNVTVLLGGIGQYQYHPESKSWENGDNGAKLPFVKTITQMICQNGTMTQQIQLPPNEPELPLLIGANAVFFPNQQLIYSGETIDYGKITGDTTKIGLLYGGIKSDLPTSSAIYPTSINNIIYEVFLIKK